MQAGFVNAPVTKGIIVSTVVASGLLHLRDPAGNYNVTLDIWRVLTEGELWRLLSCHTVCTRNSTSKSSQVKSSQVKSSQVKSSQVKSSRPTHSNHAGDAVMDSPGSCLFEEHGAVGGHVYISLPPPRVGTSARITKVWRSRDHHGGHVATVRGNGCGLLQHGPAHARTVAGGFRAAGDVLCGGAAAEASAVRCPRHRFQRQSVHVLRRRHAGVLRGLEFCRACRVRSSRRRHVPGGHVIYPVHTVAKLRVPMLFQIVVTAARNFAQTDHRRTTRPFPERPAAAAIYGITTAHGGGGRWSYIFLEPKTIAKSASKVEIYAATAAAASAFARDRCCSHEHGVRPCSGHASAATHQK